MQYQDGECSQPASSKGLLFIERGKSRDKIDMYGKKKHVNHRAFGESKKKKKGKIDNKNENAEKKKAFPNVLQVKSYKTIENNYAPQFEKTNTATSLPTMEIRQVSDLAYLHPVSKDDPILLRRINREPSTYNQPKLRLIPINELPNKHVEEALIVRDLLEVLTGFSGMYIRFSWEGILSNGKVSIPQFRLVKNINSSLKSVCGKLVTLSKQYIVLDCVSELWSDVKYGVVLQSLAFEIRSFLRDVYLNFVYEELEKEYRVNPQCSIKEFGNIVNNSSVSRCMELLYNLYFAIEEEMEFRRTLDRDVAKLKSMLSDIGYRQQTMATKSGDLFGSGNPRSETTTMMMMMEDLNVRYALLTDGDYFLYAKVV